MSGTCQAVCVMSMRRQAAAPSTHARYDFWTKACLYGALILVPLLTLSLGAAGGKGRGAAAVILLLMSVVQPAICVALLRASLSYYLAHGPRPRWWLVVSATAATAAGILAGAAALPDVPRVVANGAPPFAWVIMLFGGALTAAVTLLLRLPALIVMLAAGGVVSSGWPASSGGGGLALASGAFYCFYVGAVVLTYRASGWTLRIMWELDSARVMHARLSVAEERLRFARDLHDVLGRNLSLIAVTSELAGQLALRGDGRAAAHMLEARRVADESLREMRAVVSGYRTVDLGTECAGAQSVLRSAGVSCRIIGDAGDLPAEIQEALGWIVREGTTNVIRHSDATVCTIEFDVLDFPETGRTVRLRMDNDRVRAANAGAGGTGLLGLSERISCLGGSIVGQYPGSGRFRLEATLPAGGVVAAPSDPVRAEPALIVEEPAQ